MRQFWTKLSLLVGVALVILTVSTSDAQAGSVDWSDYIDHSAPVRPATVKQDQSQPAKATRSKRVARASKAKAKAGKAKARTKRSRR